MELCKLYDSFFYHVIVVGCIIVGIYAVGSGICGNHVSLFDYIAYGLIALSGLAYFPSVQRVRQGKNALMWIVLILQIGGAVYIAIMH